MDHVQPHDANSDRMEVIPARIRISWSLFADELFFSTVFPYHVDDYRLLSIVFDAKRDEQRRDRDFARVLKILRRDQSFDGHLLNRIIEIEGSIKVFTHS